MKAAVYHGQRDIRVETVPDPEIRAAEVLLEVKACGVCGTDASEYAFGPFQFPIERRHAASGHQGPMIPGHEFAGRVVALGDEVEGLSEGEWIVTGAGVWDDTCPRCRAGKLNLCQNYWTLGLHAHGGLAQYCAVPAKTIIRAEPYGLEGDVLGIAQPMSIAVHSMRQGRPEAGDSVAVIGVGGIGAFLVYALAASDVRVVASDLDPERRSIAAALGAQIVVDPAEVSLATMLEEHGLDVAVIYEVTGSGSGLEAALEALPTAARLVAIGLHDVPREMPIRALTLRENELIGTNAHVCTVDMPEAMRLLAARQASWRDLAPVALPLERVVDDALDPLVEGRSTRIKTLIDPWAETARDTVMPEPG